MSTVRVFNAVSQVHALTALAELATRAMEREPTIRRAALAITSDCQARDGDCELEAIFNAVKYGDSRVAGLGKGVRYVSDSLLADHFASPARILENCAGGACGGDCDDHAALVSALAGSIGFKVGLRAWGPFGHDFEHVYAVAVPKGGSPVMGRIAIGLDTTYPGSYVGWEPPNGRTMTAWMVRR